MCSHASDSSVAAWLSAPVSMTRNPVFSMVDHPSGHRYLTPGAAASFSGLERGAPVAAPRLGEHTDEILSTYLGLSDAEIGRLHDLKLVAGPG